MACDTVRNPQQTVEQRRAEVKAALAKLEQQLNAGTVKAVLDRASGSLAFAGWSNERSGVTDACAYRVLSAQGSWALRQAVAKAEATAGRRVNVQAIAAGVHSHDSGRTWGRH